ncbi:MAG: TonB-dependent receptor, partial [Rhodothermales bacterium]|nr:TonB-dependent receptor [Rhodothermales bacterium]
MCSRVLPVFLIVLFIAGAEVHAQGISGTVTDDSGVALSGASVVVKGTTMGTVTDTRGVFAVNYTGAYPVTLAISFIGFRTQEVELDAAVSNLRIQLEEEIAFGGEVVIS